MKTNSCGGYVTNITQEKLKSLLTYNEETGSFVWVRKSGRRMPIGSIAGYINQQDYRRITIENQSYMAHRLAWLYVHGRLPTQPLDHINGDKDDNRLSNLRLSSKVLNGQNRRKNKGKELPLGVSRSGRNFKATLSVEKISMRLGTFSTPELAHEEYMSKKRLLHKHHVERQDAI